MKAASKEQSALLSIPASQLLAGTAVPGPVVPTVPTRPAQGTWPGAAGRAVQGAGLGPERWLPAVQELVSPDAASRSPSVRVHVLSPRPPEQTPRPPRLPRWDRLQPGRRPPSRVGTRVVRWPQQTIDAPTGSSTLQVPHPRRWPQRLSGVSVSPAQAAACSPRTPLPVRGDDLPPPPGGRARARSQARPTAWGPDEPLGHWDGNGGFFKSVTELHSHMCFGHQTS